MNKPWGAVCVAVLVIALNSDKCYSLELSFENENNHAYASSDRSLGALLGIVSHRKIRNAVDGSLNKRIKRDTIQGQSPIYPNLPSSPYAPYPNNYYQNPSTKPQWQQSYNNNNYSQPGYPTQQHGSTQYSGTQNPYGTNYTSNSPSYKPTNYTSGPYGQNPPSPNQWQPHHPPYNGQGPQNPSTGSYPYNNNNPTPYPGFKPSNIYDYTSSRPGYQPGQNNHTYSGYPRQPSVNSSSTYPHNSNNVPYPYNSNQRPPYYPGQNQANNNGYPYGGSGSQHPVIYDDSTKRPSQNSYGNTFNNSNTFGRPYNNANGQYPQYYNTNPNAQNNGSQHVVNPYNTPNQYPPHQNPNFGQYPSGNFTNNKPGYGSQHSVNPYNPAQTPPYQNPSFGQYPSSNFSNNRPSYGSQHSVNPYNPAQTSPYQNPSFGQYPSNNTPKSTNSDPFNYGNSYNPNIPDMSSVWQQTLAGLPNNDPSKFSHHFN